MAKTLAVFIVLITAVLTGCTAMRAQNWTPTGTQTQQLSDPFYDSKYSPL